MAYPIFASFVLLSLALMFAIHRSRNGAAKRYQEFLNREIEANNTRKKPLDDVHYITIPYETLPVNMLKEDDKIADCISVLHALDDQPVVNLTGITNTDLKLRYGAPNIDHLMRCDESYTLLARTLDRWGARLHELGADPEAVTVLEFAVSTGTDVTSTYALLSKLYKENNEPEKISGLIEKAEELNSLSRRTILEILKDS